jgi:hypothetical protein
MSDRNYLDPGLGSGNGSGSKKIFQIRDVPLSNENIVVGLVYLINSEIEPQAATRVPGRWLQCAGCEPELEHSNRNLNLIPCRQYNIEPFIFCAIRRSNNVQWT